MNYTLVSSILSGQWAIDREFATGVMPLVTKLLAGESVDFGLSKTQITEPITIFAGSGVVAVGVGTNLSGVQDGTIAIYDIIGPVVKYGGACSYGATDHANELNRLANNPNVSAIILNIDSPGGQVSGTQLVADTIKAITANKPVVAMINDGIAASAAMWIASACSEIYTTKKSDAVGSIGVYMTLADMSGYYEKMGVKIRDVYASQSTDKNGAIREALAGNDDQLVENLNTTAEQFIQVIRDNRGEKLTNDKWATGKMFRSKEAQKIGLIDGTKTVEQIIARTNQLISTQTTTKNKMQTKEVATTEQQPVVAVIGGNPVAFTRIMAAAKIEAIAVTDEGFAMDEGALNNLEQHIEGQDATITEQATTIANLEQKVQEMGNQDHQATIAERDQTIASLNERISKLEAQPDGDFQSTTKDADTNGKPSAANKYLTSFDQDKARLRAKAGK
jgi:signal peptide peptidase SppA